MHTPDMFFGLSCGGRLSQDDLVRASCHQGGTTEIMTHPGLPAQIELDKYAHWNYSWAQEYETLASASLTHLLDRTEGQLISFKELT